MLRIVLVVVVVECNGYQIAAQFDCAQDDGVHDIVTTLLLVRGSCLFHIFIAGGPSSSQRRRDRWQRSIVGGAVELRHLRRQ